MELVLSEKKASARACARARGHLPNLDSNLEMVHILLAKLF